MVNRPRNLETKHVTCESKKKCKAPGYPRRPLSAYNIFFKVQRHCIIHGLKGIDDIQTIQDIIGTATAVKHPKGKRIHRTSHGKIGFAELARKISQRWKECHASTKALFQELSKRDKARYHEEKLQYTFRELARNTKLAKTLSCGTSSVEQNNPIRIQNHDIEPLPFASSIHVVSLDQDAKDFILSALLRDD